MECAASQTALSGAEAEVKRVNRSILSRVAQLIFRVSAHVVKVGAQPTEGLYGSLVIVW
jgi:hypothetical protein